MLLNGLFLLLVYTSPPAKDCKAQFAPLTTGSYSGASRVPFWSKEVAGAWSGPGWLGWAHDGDQLMPVQLVIRDRPKDDAEDEPLVTVESMPQVTFAVRCVP